MDISQAAKQRGKYLPLATNTEVNKDSEITLIQHKKMILTDLQLQHFQAPIMCTLLRGETQRICKV